MLLSCSPGSISWNGHKAAVSGFQAATSSPACWREVINLAKIVPALTNISDIHIVKNPANGGLSPWYPAKEGPYSIVTPEWVLYSTQLYSWSKK